MIDQGEYEQQLIEAIRKRLLDEVGRGQASSVINNNVYGGQIPSGGVQAMLQNQGVDPEDRSYFVDILRQNYDPGDTAQFYDPESGEPTDVQLDRGGWGKRVHRFSTPKKKDLMGQ